MTSKPRPEPAQEAVAWIRVHPDGTYTDDILPEWRIEQVRRDSGGWVRLVRGDSPAPTSATVSERAAEPGKGE